MPVVVESSCVLVQDALTSLKQNVSANINFAHTETILPVLKYLGKQSARGRILGTIPLKGGF